MARKLKDYSWDDQTFKYPWDYWLNGETWEITKDDLSPVARKSTLVKFVPNLYRNAADRGLKMRTKREGDEKITFQAYKEGEE